MSKKVGQLTFKVAYGGGFFDFEGQNLTFQSQFLEFD